MSRAGDPVAGRPAAAAGAVPGPDERRPDTTSGRGQTNPRRRAVGEILIIAVLFGVYKVGRVVSAQKVASAYDNAYAIWDLERALLLPDEASVQALILGNTALIKAANVYYVAAHFPVTIGFLVWLYLRRPADYRRLRRTLATLTGAGLLVHLALPVAPPRMLGRLGFVDTADVYGPAVYGPPGSGSLADQYAAMPSLHIGWAMLVSMGIIATVRGRWRWLSMVHPLLTSLVVIVTANHFWLDGLVAGALLALSLVAVRALSRRRWSVTGGIRADRPDGRSSTVY